MTTQEAWTVATSAVYKMYSNGLRTQLCGRPNGVATQLDLVNPKTVQDICHPEAKPFKQLTRNSNRNL